MKYVFMNKIHKHLLYIERVPVFQSISCFDGWLMFAPVSTSIDRVPVAGRRARATSRPKLRA